MTLNERQRAYWRANLILTASLLAVWFVVPFVAGLYAAELNRLSFLGFPLGFYVFAQGAILVFLAIVAIYVFVMNRLDRRYGSRERG